MTSPGYVIIPLDADETTADWRFGRSRDQSHLSPVRVSKTLHKLVQRVLRTHLDERWKVLPFDMEANRSPVAGKQLISIGRYSGGLCASCQCHFLRASAMLKHVIAIGLTSVCPSVRPSVRPSHAGTLSKRLNILSCFLRHTIAHSF